MRTGKTKPVTYLFCKSCGCKAMDKKLVNDLCVRCAKKTEV